jgi:hypothetical protein
MPIEKEGCNDTLQNPFRFPPQPNVVTLKKHATPSRNTTLKLLPYTLRETKLPPFRKNRPEPRKRINFISIECGEFLARLHREGDKYCTVNPV